MNSKIKFALAFLAFGSLTLGYGRVTYAAPPSDPCSLLTTAQVSTALGITVGAGKQSGQADCQWSQPGSGFGGKGILLEILGPMGNLTAVDRFNTVKNPLPIRGITKEPVGGIGDDAVYIAYDTTRISLYVKKGSSVFRVQVTGLKEKEDAKAKEKALALDVLANL
jgi:hypothetical protein